jgi:signal transduction histidine kinase
MGYTESLSDGKLHGSPEMYGVMHKEAQHLSHLIDDLRTLSLADAGELPLTRRAVAPLELLNRIAEAYQVQAQQQQITLNVQSAPDLPDIDVDPDRMVQVLGNLVSNAFRFTPEGGTISLSAATNAAHVHIQVKDSGAGIDPADLPHIFSRFYRGDKSRPHDGESGLGLAIVRSIVEAHGGQITADSTPGAVTTFTITLPITVST